MALLIFLGYQQALQQYYIEQTSMTPTLEEGQRLLVSKIVYSFHPPERGDIIVFHPPEDPDGIPLIKRVIGLPGETVEVKSGEVYINGSSLDEPYIKEPPHYIVKETTVPLDNYFVLGDNRNGSRDSHSGWTVPEENIIGKTWLSLWPPDVWGMAPNYEFSGD